MFKPTFSRFLLAASVLVIVAGCSSNDVKEENAPAALLDFEPERKLNSVWSRSVGNGQGKQDFLRLTPAIAGDKIFAASTDGEVAAFDKLNGDKFWDTEIEDDSVIGGVGTSEDIVLVTTTSGKLVALEASNGEQRWSVQLPSEALAPAVGDGSVVVVHTYNGDVIGFAQADGKKVWSYSSSVPALTLRGSSGPVIHRDFVINTFANGKLAVLDKETGALRWEARVGVPEGTTELDRLVDVDANPLIDNGVLYAVGYQGRIVAVDPENGRLSWYNNASSSVNMSVNSESIFVAGSKGSVTAFSLNGDGVRWEQTALANRELSGTAAINNTVVVGDVEGYLHVLSSEDGHMVARTKVDSKGVRVAPIVDGDIMYVFTNSGKLIAYRVDELGTSSGINFRPSHWVKDLF